MPVSWLARYIEAATRTLVERLRTTCEPGPAFVLDCRKILERRLAATTARTFVLELHVASLSGHLRTATSEDRFEEFCRALESPDAAATLLDEYPELRRRIGAQVDGWVTACADLGAHLETDRDAIATLLGRRRLGRLSHLEDLGAEQHRGGRFPALIVFDGGEHVVYKPRSSAVDRAFGALIAWTAERGFTPALRAAACIDCGDHGWSEWIEQRECETPAHAERFFERQGGWLALTRVLQATDLHFENLIAAGEHPVIVDLETLFHPASPGPTGVDADIAAAELITNSILRTGLVPAAYFQDADYGSVDLSGLEARPGQRLPTSALMVVDGGTDRMRFETVGAVVTGGRNRARIDGEPLGAFANADRILDGFVRMYEVLLRERDVLVAPGGPLDPFAGVATRVVLRPTRVYGLCLQACLHPDALKNAASARRILEALPPLPHRDGDVLRRAEWRDLMAGDVPVFSSRPDSRDVWTSCGERIRNVFDRPPLDVSREVLSAMGDADMDRQIALLAAALATIAPPETRITARDEVPVPVRSEGTISPVCFDLACAIGDRLAATAIRSRDEATWIGLSVSAQGRLIAGPLANDLYSGLPGIALYLGELARATDRRCYEDLARASIRLVCRRMARPATWESIGAFAGWSGIAYVLARLHRLWGDPDLREHVEHALAAIERRIDTTEADVVGGRAGCVLALLSVADMLPRTGAGSLAERVGAGLLDWIQPRPGLAAPLTGFAHGAAGIACALDRLTAATGNSAFHSGADAALGYERSARTASGDERVAWCHGAVGIGLGRLASHRVHTDRTARDEIAMAVRTTLSAGFPRDHSLCHGQLGSLELLSRAAHAGLADAGTVRDMTVGVVSELQANSWICGVPAGCETPGLMTGLAGIGYGLLRLAVGPQLPSVLTLDS